MTPTDDVVGCNCGDLFRSIVSFIVICCAVNCVYAKKGGKKLIPIRFSFNKSPKTLKNTIYNYNEDSQL